jgi:hypothetical protein
MHVREELEYSEEFLQKKAETEAQLHALGLLKGQENNAKINDLVERDGVLITLLECAIEEGDIFLVRVLLEQGADPNFQNPHNLQRTSLHIAVQVNSAKLVQLLLESGAKVYAPDKTGVTPVGLCLQTFEFDGTKPREVTADEIKFTEEEIEATTLYDEIMPLLLAKLWEELPEGVSMEAVFYRGETELRSIVATDSGDDGDAIDVEEYQRFISRPLSSPPLVVESDDDSQSDESLTPGGSSALQEEDLGVPPLPPFQGSNVVVSYGVHFEEGIAGGSGVSSATTAPLGGGREYSPCFFPAAGGEFNLSRTLPPMPASEDSVKQLLGYLDDIFEEKTNRKSSVHRRFSKGCGEEEGAHQRLEEFIRIAKERLARPFQDFRNKYGRKESTQVVLIALGSINFIDQASIDVMLQLIETDDATKELIKSPSAESTPSGGGARRFSFIQSTPRRLSSVGFAAPPTHS